MDTNDAIDAIKEIWHGPSEEALVRRVRVLFNLALACPSGNVVELGTHQGYGAFAMAYGAYPAMVFTVDDYKEKKGWAGEDYGPQDYRLFRYNMFKLGLDGQIGLLRLDAVEASYLWKPRSIGLLYVDTGVVETIPKIVQAWHSRMVIGGIIAMRDTLTKSLGCDKVAEKAIQDGAYESVISPDDYFILLRKREIT